MIVNGLWDHLLEFESEEWLAVVGDHWVVVYAFAVMLSVDFGGLHLIGFDRWIHAVLDGFAEGLSFVSDMLLPPESGGQPLIGLGLQMHAALGDGLNFALGCLIRPDLKMNAAPVV